MMPMTLQLPGVRMAGREILVFNLCCLRADRSSPLPVHRPTVACASKLMARFLKATRAGATAVCREAGGVFLFCLFPEQTHRPSSPPGQSKPTLVLKMSQSVGETSKKKSPQTACVLLASRRVIWRGSKYPSRVSFDPHEPMRRKPAHAHFTDEETRKLPTFTPRGQVAGPMCQLG